MADGKVICRHCKLPLGYYKIPTTIPKLSCCYPCSKKLENEEKVKMIAYCVKCKTKNEMIDPAEVVMKNGRKAMKGKCPKCNTGMFKIIGKA